jgi:fructose-1,6-bisphosphatase I
MAIDGQKRILDLVPQKLHQRTPLFLGSKGDVTEAARMLA